ncbi:Phage protein [Lactococcus lactis subsp. lactis]|uniref:DUF4190 domain-containing protein n=2 Tax=Lactococcus lactis TaxID=1358 RepID=A0A2A5SF33_LACLH|nr:hypothetical protein [Lactococcus lactis]KAA8702383.1 DUF4190 domain-containing protein [Lactococcus lactis subsp. hordniae]KSU08395.1 Phage protein [Lactococcus lactis subsp. lactis]MCT3134929.1 DUF4190 domain-containing protein [Lactococcus lactis]PCS12084.1 prophage pi3 protein 59 [Lactococcus lactis subsp. hordniae]
MEKKKESKVLAIIALIIGILALILSWVPIVNNFAAVLAVVSAILGLIAIIINRKNKKTLSIVSFVISVLAFIIVMATQSMYSSAIDSVGKKVNSDISSSQKKADDNFKWAKTDYDALVVGDTMTGLGGTNYDGLEAKFGTPSDSNESSSGDYTVKDVSWNNMGASKYKSISLTFVKQADGSWLLSHKYQSGLE